MQTNQRATGQQVEDQQDVDLTVTPKIKQVLTQESNAQSSLTQAYLVQALCAEVGFDWTSLQPVVEKVEEEIAEVMQVVTEQPTDTVHLQEELGDLLFAVVNLVRHLQQDPDKALRQATQKFAQRFQAVEHIWHQQGKQVSECTAEELDKAWMQVKQQQ